MAQHRFLRVTATLTGLAMLGACASSDPVYSAFGREAGALLDTGDFGNSTMNNTQVMNGEKRYVYDLSQRFAREVPTTINFAFNSAALDAEARRVLSAQAHWIKQFPEVRFRVYGHTDKVGSEAYNKRLGLRRAHAAVNYLASLGISLSRLEAVVSYGETQPIVVTQGRERRNRRTVTEVSGFVGSHPMILDGRYAEVIYREYIESAVPPSRLSEGSGIGGGDG